MTARAPDDTDDTGSRPAVRLGPYVLQERIGRGGMAEVFLAHHEGDATRPVVVKRMYQHLLDGDDRFAIMFLREVRIAARLSHPNIVEVFDVGRDGPQYFMAMEHLQGLTAYTLAKRVWQARGSLPLPLVAHIICDAARGLEHAHALPDETGAPGGLVHRDISPDNLFVTTSGVTKLLDFGIARLRTSERITRTGEIRGKIRYMSPEQLGAGDVDARADIYSLGVALYLLLTGRRAFDGANDPILINEVLTATPPPPSSINQALPRELDHVVSLMIRRDRERRMPSASAVLASLAPYTQGELGRVEGARFVARALALPPARAARDGEPLAVELAVTASPQGAFFDDASAGTEPTRITLAALQDISESASEPSINTDSGAAPFASSLQSQSRSSLQEPTLIPIALDSVSSPSHPPIGTVTPGGPNTHDRSTVTNQSDDSSVITGITPRDPSSQSPLPNDPDATQIASTTRADSTETFVQRPSRMKRPALAGDVDPTLHDVDIVSSAPSATPVDAPAAKANVELRYIVAAVVGIAAAVAAPTAYFARQPRAIASEAASTPATEPAAEPATVPATPTATAVESSGAEGAAEEGDGDDDDDEPAQVKRSGGSAPAKRRVSLKAPSHIEWRSTKGKLIARGDGVVSLSKQTRKIVAVDTRRRGRTTVNVSDAISFASLPTGEIKLMVLPWADVYLGKEHLGRTPGVKPVVVTAGSYDVKLVYEGREKLVSVQVPAGKRVTVRENLEEQ